MYITIKTPAKERARSTSYLRLVPLAKSPIKAMKVARTVVVDAPVIMANNIIDIDPNPCPYMRGKNEKAYKRLSATTVTLDPDNTSM